MFKRELILGMAVTMGTAGVLSAAAPITARAEANYDMRKKVIGLSGIMTVTELNSEVTRAQFAQMLVMASPYRSTVTAISSTSVFADVPRTSEYSAYIRIAVEQGWMTGYLGGVFKPDNYITMQEAARAILALLGYTNSDFSGDQYGARMAKYYYLELNENIYRETSDTLTKDDCIELFYNLLKTDMANGNTHYGSVLDCELTSDGEINALTIADNTIKGPKVATRSRGISDVVPFDVKDANCFLDGNAVTMTTLKQVLQDDSYLVIYYSTSAKTIWAYSESGDSESDKRVVRGEVTNIYYGSTSGLTPSAIVIDSQDEYKLTSTDMQFAFSIYGTIKVGDYVVLIYSTSSTGEDTQSYTVVDYVEE